MDISHIVKIDSGTVQLYMTDGSYLQVCLGSTPEHTELSHCESGEQFPRHINLKFH